VCILILFLQVKNEHKGEKYENSQENNAGGIQMAMARITYYSNEQFICKYEFFLYAQLSHFSIWTEGTESKCGTTYFTY
jgi:hypothetical protein